MEKTESKLEYLRAIIHFFRDFGSCDVQIMCWKIFLTHEMIRAQTVISFSYSTTFFLLSHVKRESIVLLRSGCENQ